MTDFKATVVTAYVDVSKGNWEAAKKQLSGAIAQFTSLLNSVGQNFQNQTLVNQCYILVNELNTASLKAKIVFPSIFKEFRSILIVFQV